MPRNSEPFTWLGMANGNLVYNQLHKLCEWAKETMHMSWPICKMFMFLI